MASPESERVGEPPEALARLALPRALPLQQMLDPSARQGINDGKGAFYVEPASGHRAWVEVATRLGKEYLKTERDNEQPDNLLALPECPNKGVKT